MDPDVAGKIPGCLAELGPEFATVDISFIRARGTEGDAQADHETKHGEKDLGYNEFVDEFRDAGDECRP